MVIKGLIFDINGTLTNINTYEGHSDIYRTLSNLLSYQGVFIGPNDLMNLYFATLKRLRKASGERYPEFDAVAIFREIIRLHATDFTLQLPPEKIQQLPLLLAEVFRAGACFRLELYQGVKETISELHKQYQLSIVSDGQSAYALPELNAVGLLNSFSPIIISGDFGFRKPDKRLFEKALAAMKMQAEEVLFIGNDMYRDVCGAQRIGLKTIFYKSNQGAQEKEGIEPDYIIYTFPELLQAVHFFENR
ncbi:MAG: HAD family hydrolase [Candidatus Electrothrix sp. AR3]|nr:HAD family hydrolase [Candidatus Electrothrix sp. AR3]